MPVVEQYDVLIVGCGEAGKYLAWEMAKAGHSTVVVERRLVGGSCPNIACLPSKNVIHSAKVVALSHRGAEFGAVTAVGGAHMAAVRRRKRTMVDSLIEMHLDRFTESGAELVLGEGRFVTPKTVDVRLAGEGTRRLAGQRVFLNLGTHAAIPDIKGLVASQPLTHVEALDLDRLPAHLIVLGGGYVGLEFAQAFRRFGSRVTVVEQNAQLAPREDPDMADALLQIFSDEGIDVALSSELLEVQGLSGEWIRVRLRTGDHERTIDATDILVAAGRTPNTTGVGLDVAGVALDDRGYVQVNERLETTAPGIWAMGDCAGSPQLTHAAFDDFRIVRDVLAGGHRSTTNRLVPFCIFTDPMLARVGLNEVEARQRGLEPRVAKLPMTAVLRARAIAETRGFMKMLIAGDDDRILGFTMLGHEAGEVMTVVQTAMLAGYPYTGLRDAILTHPTMAEGLTLLLANVQTSSEESLDERPRRSGARVAPDVRRRFHEGFDPGGHA